MLKRKLGQLVKMEILGDLELSLIQNSLLFPL